MYIYIYIYTYIYNHIFFIHLPVGHLGCFCILAIVQNAAMHTGCMYRFKLMFCFLRYIYPGIELLDHMVVLFLVFCGISILFSIVVVPIHIPTNSVQELKFLHILANICYLCSFWWQPFWQVWGDIVVLICTSLIIRNVEWSKHFQFPPLLTSRPSSDKVLW